MGTKRFDIHSLKKTGVKPIYMNTEPADFDKYDAVITFSKERTPLIHLVGIARRMRINSKTLEYHYRAHIVGKLLLGYEVNMPLETEPETFLYRFESEDKTSSEKLISILMNLRNVKKLDKVENSPSVLMHAEMPREEKLPFTDYLVKVAKRGIIKSFSASEILHPGRFEFRALSTDLYDERTGWTVKKIEM